MAWISVEDRLPETDVTVLVASNGFHWLAWYDAQKTWQSFYDNIFFTIVTHWMPISRLPKGHRLDDYHGNDDYAWDGEDQDLLNEAAADDITPND